MIGVIVAMIVAVAVAVDEGFFKVQNPGQQVQTNELSGRTYNKNDRCECSQSDRGRPAGGGCELPQD